MLHSNHAAAADRLRVKRCDQRFALISGSLNVTNVKGARAGQLELVPPMSSPTFEAIKAAVSVDLHDCRPERRERNNT